MLREVLTEEEIPVTNPVELTVTLEILLLLQTPPLVEFESCIVEPSQTFTVLVGVIAGTMGRGCTTYSSSFDTAEHATPLTVEVAIRRSLVVAFIGPGLN